MALSLGQLPACNAHFGAGYLAGCSVDNRKQIMANVMLTGGNTLFDGLPQMLFKKLKSVRARMLTTTERRRALIFFGTMLSVTCALGYVLRMCRLANRERPHLKSRHPKTDRSQHGSAVRFRHRLPVHCVPTLCDARQAGAGRDVGLQCARLLAGVLYVCRVCFWCDHRLGAGVFVLMGGGAYHA